MQLVDAGGNGKWLLNLLKGVLILVFVDLGALIAVILAHGVLSAGWLVLAAGALAIILLLFSVSSVAVGIAYAWRSFPGHRRAIVFLAAITLATLLAHAYAIGTPAAATSGSATGQVGSTFGDSGVTAATSVANSSLQVTLTAGSHPVAQAEVSIGGTALLGGWQASSPSFASPLQSGDSATGSWQLPPGESQENVTVSYQYLTCYDAGSKSYGCIMDEIFYVPEGMGMLAGQHCFTGAGAPSDCHMEHPPLSPALMAAGMAIFGEYNVVGWRFMPALLGTFSIPLIFGVAWKASDNKKLAYLSATLLALDVMFFSQSGAGLLDIPEIFFGLAAFFAYFADVRVWKFDRYVIAGVLLGVAGLAKETAVFIAAAFVTFVLFFGEGDRWTRVYSALKVTLVVGVVFFAGLQAYDSTLGGPGYTFLDNINYIFSYGSSLVAHQLACQPTTGYWCKFPSQAGGPPILPTDWLLYYSPVAYYAVSVCPSSVGGVCHGAYEAVAYYGVTNFLVTWTVFVWVPLAAYALFRHFRRTEGVETLAADGKAPEPSGGAAPARPGPLPAELRFAGLALILFLWNYVPYLFLFIDGRVTYPFYVLPAVPAMAMGASFWLSRSWFPRWLLYVYLAMVFGFFLIYFPDKAFLPIWLRSLIGR